MPTAKPTQRPARASSRPCARIRRSRNAWRAIARGDRHILDPIELRGEIGPNEIALAEIQYDQDDKLIQGNLAEPFYRFKRMGAK